MKVVAFIPVRGGSKSIPLKNIKHLGGKPLVCWSIEALEACEKVDEIIVATDSDEIWKTVEEKHYCKTTLYHRNAENARDTASTESVMLEYIMASQQKHDNVFMLVQATSPMTQAFHFSEAIQMYENGNFDSILSCVRCYRFFWNEDGTSMNYDYKNRPRRQDFKGLLMENGAFYINTVGNIIASGSRLSGKIGIYNMPEYTATEIDEPEDWVIMEELIRRHVIRHKERKDIKLFLSDVDGTLTDGGMYYSENGDELKKFNTRDGMGFQLLRETGVKTGIVTSEKTRIVENRAKKLKLDYLVQGEKGVGKLSSVKKLCKDLRIALEEVAYIGDDINCLELLKNVGLAACPVDACEEVKNIPDIMVINKRGGDGCVRAFIDSLIKK